MWFWIVLLVIACAVLVWVMRRAARLSRADIVALPSVPVDSSPAPATAPSAPTASDGSSAADSTTAPEITQDLSGGANASAPPV